MNESINYEDSRIDSRNSKMGMEMNSIKGSYIFGDFVENRKLAKKSRNEAKQYEWLYQCTKLEFLRNIIKSREIWLSNLRDVNDQEEVARINVPEYENSYFVGCFSYDYKIGQDNWAEYGKDNDGILYGFKKEWVKKEAKFLLPSEKELSFDKDLKIYRNADEARKITEKEWNTNHRECFPYYFFDFNFYKVIYDNDLKTAMDCSCEWEFDSIKLKNGRFISTDLPGIVKMKKGICIRPDKDSYIKNWEDEKEVRLKVGVQSDHGILPPDIYIPQLAVKLSDNAFENLKIAFNPKMYEEDKDRTLVNLHKLLPESKIQILE